MSTPQGPTPVAPLSDDHLRRLHVFNEKADKLKRSRFKAAMFDQPTGVTLSWTAETSDATTEIRGPDEEAVDAFILTLRFFLRDPDGISFNKLAEIYDAPGIPPELCERLHQLRDALNAHLAGQPLVQINVNGESLTRGRILNVFIYGDLAHTNEEKQAAFAVWNAHPMARALLQNEFHALVAEVFNCILYVQHLNKQLLGEDVSVDEPYEAAPAA
jgi:hypothetical protein